MKATVSKISKRIQTEKSKIEGIIPYDIDNNYPNRIKDIVFSSSMGKSCAELYRKFIFGRGFSDVSLSSISINRNGLTADKLLYKISKDVAYNSGFAIQINYNALYEKTEFNFIPFHRVRLVTHDNKKHPGKIAIYKDWAEKGLKEKDIEYFDRYDPRPEIIQQQVDAAGGWDLWKGQIAYIVPDDNIYPLAMFDACLEDMQTDAQSKVYKFRNVSTNFMASHLLIRDPDEKNGDDNNSNGQDSISDSLTDFQGADNAMKIMEIEKTHPEQKFELVPVQVMNGDRLYEFTESSTRNNIRQAFLIPPVLLMEMQGRIGGTADEIIDATKSYNSTTEDERYWIEFNLKNIFTNCENPELNNREWNILPRAVVTKDDSQKKQSIIDLVSDTSLTANQKKKILVDLYEVDENDAYEIVNPTDKIGSEQLLAERLGVGGTQSLTSILSDAVMTIEQKRGALEILFGLDKEQVDKLVPIPNVNGNT